MIQTIQNAIKEHLDISNQLLKDEKNIKLIEKISLAIIKSLKKNGKVIFAGNGGSFSDAMHLAGEFIGKLKLNRRPLAAIALGTNSSIITAIGNDYNFENVFQRELEAIAGPNDILIAISTSGNSKNIINAVNKAKKKKIKIFGLTSIKKNKLSRLCECIKINSNNTPRIQEMHIMIGHIICGLVERDLFKI